MMRISPNSLDPLDDSQGDSVARKNLTELLFDTLVITDAQVTSIQRSPRPGRGSGNQRWIFSLRHEVKFHDGSSSPLMRWLPITQCQSELARPCGRFGHY